MMFSFYVLICVHKKTRSNPTGATPGSVSIRIPNEQQDTSETLASGLLAFGSSAGLRSSPQRQALKVTGKFPVPTSIPDYSGGTATDLHRVPG